MRFDACAVSEAEEARFGTRGHCIPAT
jgi:hypothetical protein